MSTSIKAGGIRDNCRNKLRNGFITDLLFFLVRKINHLLLTHISQTRTTPALARTQKFCTLGSGNLTFEVYRYAIRLVSGKGAKPRKCQVLYYPDISQDHMTACSNGLLIISGFRDFFLHALNKINQT